MRMTSSSYIILLIKLLEDIHISDWEWSWKISWSWAPKETCVKREADGKQRRLRCWGFKLGVLLSES